MVFRSDTDCRPDILSMRLSAGWVTAIKFLLQEESQAIFL